MRNKESKFNIKNKVESNSKRDVNKTVTSNNDNTIDDNIKNESTNEIINTNNNKLQFKKKSKVKGRAKATQFYLSDKSSAGIDKICKQTGFSKNEIANRLIEFALDNSEVIE